MTMNIFNKKSPEALILPDYIAWCELVSILNNDELDRLVIVKSHYKDMVGNKITGRFYLDHYLNVVKRRRKIAN